MRYLLDTHVFLWWSLGERRLPRDYARVLDACERSGEPVALSSMTLWEICWLAAQGRLKDAGAVDDLLDSVESNELLTVLPLDLRVARQAASFGADFPKDPGDRIIAATANVHGLILLTADERIRASGAVDVS